MDNTSKSCQYFLSPRHRALVKPIHFLLARMWDVKPFAPADRCVKMFEGAPQGYEKNLIRPCWSPDGNQIASGSSDRSVVVWEVLSRKILYKLPGHKGCVNDVDWHPKEPIIVSGSTDRSLYLGEVKPSQ